MKRYIYVSILLLSISIIFSGCSLKNEDIANENRPIPVNVENVELKTISETQRFVGTTEAVSDIQVLPKVSGRVEEVFVSQGDQVKKGQLLIKLDDTDLKHSLDQAQAGYNSALANLTQAKETSSSSVIKAENQLKQADDAYQKAKDSYEKYQKMYDDKLVSKAQLDQVESTYIQAETNLAVAKDALEKAKSDSGIAAFEAQVEQSKSMVQQAQGALSDTKIVAPIDGQIASIKVEAGEMATPQSPVAQIVNQEGMIVKLNISEVSINNFKVNDKVKVNFPSTGEQVEGTVSFVASAINNQTMTFPVEIEVQNPKNKLKSGIFAEVILETVMEGKQLTIPTQAVMGTGNDTYVFVVKEQQAEKRMVTVKAMATETTVIADGLKENEKIVIKGQYQLTDGALVEIVGEEGTE